MTSRIAALDLLRGVAVLGIVAVNVANFAGGPSAIFSPDLLRPGTPLDHAAYALTLALFEGKMRALFSILFGASLLLFVERSEAAGRAGTRLQLRRLGWLALIGYLHFLLLWEGDILFLYAAVGLAALGLRHLKPVSLAAIGMITFLCWQGWGAMMWAPGFTTEAAVRSGTATPAQSADYARIIAQKRQSDRAALIAARSGFAAQVREKWTGRAFDPLATLFFNFGETLSYQLIGMALFKAGFFAGGWSRRALGRTAAVGIALGGAATLAFAIWALTHGFPELAMRFMLGFGMGLPHLAMALGYASALILAAPRLLATTLGRRLAAAGRTAFSNYLGTSLILGAAFYGWGLGLVGHYGTAGQIPFVLGVWALMLAWSAPWLARFRQGPLEWAWRSLTEWRALPLVRS